MNKSSNPEKPHSSSFRRSMGKQLVVYPHYGILLSNAKEQTTDTRNNLAESSENCA